MRCLTLLAVLAIFSPAFAQKSPLDRLPQQQITLGKKPGPPTVAYTVNVAKTMTATRTVKQANGTTAQVPYTYTVMVPESRQKQLQFDFRDRNGKKLDNKQVHQRLGAGTHNLYKFDPAAQKQMILYAPLLGKSAVIVFSTMPTPAKAGPPPAKPDQPKPPKPGQLPKLPTRKVKFGKTPDAPITVDRVSYRAETRARVVTRQDPATGRAVQITETYTVQVPVLQTVEVKTLDFRDHKGNKLTKAAAFKLLGGKEQKLPVMNEQAQIRFEKYAKDWKSGTVVIFEQDTQRVKDQQKPPAG